MTAGAPITPENAPNRLERPLPRAEAQNTGAGAPKQMGRPWRSYLTLPGPQPGILIVRETGPRSWFRPKELAAHLGMKNENAIYRWLAEGKINGRFTKQLRGEKLHIHRDAIPLITRLLAESGILLKESAPPRPRIRREYRLKAFAELWGLGLAAALAWLNDGTIPRQLTRRNRSQHTVINCAAIPIIEQLLGKPACYPTRSRSGAGQAIRYAYCQFWASTVAPGILPRRGRMYAVLTPLTAAELMPHAPRAPLGQFRALSTLEIGPHPMGQSPAAATALITGGLNLP